MPVRPLHPELQEKARLELGEDPETLEENIHHLKQWILKQPHLKARTGILLFFGLNIYATDNLQKEVM